MPVARVVCVVTLRAELYDARDDADARLAAEEKALEAATKNTAAAKAGQAKAPLNPDAPGLGDESPTGTDRPFFVLPNVVPRQWSFVFNSFRRADELEITLPLALLPVAPEAIRVLSCYASVRQLSAEEWERWGRGETVIEAGPGGFDFAGIARKVSDHVEGDKAPTVKLSFHDFLGLLASKKVEPGATLARKVPLSQAIKEFIKGCGAEGIDVVWKGKPTEEPEGDRVPKVQKKPKKGSAKPTRSSQSYLDAIVEECSAVGVVPRLQGTTLELNDAGPVYDGDPTPKATILVGQVVESFEAEHELVGVKTQPVQVVGYNPDTGDLYTARWPPNPKSVKAEVVEPGKPPRLPPLAANVGLPGYEQLDESVVLIPVGAVTGGERLVKLARMLFLERTRQRIRYTLRTHAPWSNPLEPDRDGGDLLRLRAGDNVFFGLLAEGGLLPPEVQVLSGGADEGVLGALLRAAGAQDDVATSVARALARAPRQSVFRVDELHVSGGEKQAAELSLRLVNFVLLYDDVARKADGRSPAELVRSLEANAFLLSSMSRADVDLVFDKAQAELDAGSGTGAERAAAQAKLDALRQSAMRGR